MHYAVDFHLPFDLTGTPSADNEVSPAMTFDFASRYSNRQLSYVYDLNTTAREVSVSNLPWHVEKVDKVKILLSRSITYRTPLPDGFNWGFFALVTACTPFFVWGAVRGYRYEFAGHRDTGAESLRLSEPVGRSLGGWLGVLGFGLVVGFFQQLWGMVHLGNFYSSLSNWRALSTPGLPSYRPGLALLCAPEFVLMLGHAVYSILIGTLFFRKKRSFPKHFVIFAVATLVYTVIDTITTIIVASPARVEENVTTVVRVIVWAAIWIPYVRASRRVRETFVC